jgi:hypothetical protein
MLQSELNEANGFPLIGQRASHPSAQIVEVEESEDADTWQVNAAASW